MELCVSSLFHNIKTQCHAVKLNVGSSGQITFSISAHNSIVHNFEGLDKCMENHKHVQETGLLQDCDAHSTLYILICNSKESTKRQSLHCDYTSLIILATLRTAT